MLRSIAIPLFAVMDARRKSERRRVEARTILLVRFVDTREHCPVMQVMMRPAVLDQCRRSGCNKAPTNQAQRQNASGRPGDLDTGFVRTNVDRCDRRLSPLAQPVTRQWT